MLWYLKNGICNQIQGWEKIFISQGSKEVLLKTVTQAVPNYAMSIFLLGSELCKDLGQLMNKYWWKNSSNKKKSIHRMYWDKLSRKKIKGA